MVIKIIPGSCFTVLTRCICDAEEISEEIS